MRDNCSYHHNRNLITLASSLPEKGNDVKVLSGCMRLKLYQDANIPGRFQGEVNSSAHFGLSFSFNIKIKKKQAIYNYNLHYQTAKPL